MCVCVLFVLLFLVFQDIDWVQTEKHVFEQASNHPFLVGLHSCFQTESRSVCTRTFKSSGLQELNIVLFYEFFFPHFKQQLFFPVNRWIHNSLELKSKGISPHFPNNFSLAPPFLSLKGIFPFFFYFFDFLDWFSHLLDSFL